MNGFVRKMAGLEERWGLQSAQHLYEKRERSGSIPLTSVADPGCLSRIPDPDFYPSRIPEPGSRISDLGSWIPDPKTGTKERGEKNFLSKTFL
jgi:hypothetical protein